MTLKSVRQYRQRYLCERYQHHVLGLLVALAAETSRVVDMQVRLELLEQLLNQIKITEATASYRETLVELREKVRDRAMGAEPMPRLRVVQ